MESRAAVKRDWRALALLFLGLTFGPWCAAEPAVTKTAAGALIAREAFSPRTLRPDGDVASVLQALDYAVDEVPRVYADDLDGDGASEYLIVSHDRLCGTAGCPYALLDGHGMREIGNFFGHVALLDARINGFPVIQAMSKRDLSAVNLSTFVFDGGRYREVAYSLLNEPGVSEWHRRIVRKPPPAAPR